jgi:hypothetical protein
MRGITTLRHIHAGCTQVVQRWRVALNLAAWKGAIYVVHIEPSISIASAPLFGGAGKIVRALPHFSSDSVECRLRMRMLPPGVAE